MTRQNMTIIDVRNFYESMIGSFRDAIKPKTRNFKEFKRAIVNKLETIRKISQSLCFVLEEFDVKKLLIF